MSGEIYKNRTRIRVNGLLIEQEAILLIQIQSPVTHQLIWMPPGGGLEFGECIGDCLNREFEEETGLEVRKDALVAINELVKPPFHAVELYFKVKKIGGQLHEGHDPEHEGEAPVIKDLRWFPLDEVHNLATAPEPLPQWIAQLQSAKENHDVIFQTNQS